MGAQRHEAVCTSGHQAARSITGSQGPTAAGADECAGTPCLSKWLEVFCSDVDCLQLQHLPLLALCRCRHGWRRRRHARLCRSCCCLGGLVPARSCWPIDARVVQGPRREKDQACRSCLVPKSCASGEGAVRAAGRLHSNDQWHRWRNGGKLSGSAIGGRPAHALLTEEIHAGKACKRALGGPQSSERKPLPLPSSPDSIRPASTGWGAPQGAKPPLPTSPASSSRRPDLFAFSPDNTRHGRGRGSNGGPPSGLPRGGATAACAAGGAAAAAHARPALPQQPGRQVFCCWYQQQN